MRFWGTFAEVLAVLCLVALPFAVFIGFAGIVGDASVSFDLAGNVLVTLLLAITAAAAARICERLDAASPTDGEPADTADEQSR